MRIHSLSRQRGTTLVEVLVTVIILAFGLLGIAALQAKAQVGTVESYQRAQAVVLLQDISARLNSNSGDAASYVTASAVGTGDSEPVDCSTLTGTAAQDLCAWSATLKGAAEVDTASNTKVGAMLGARGCIEELQAQDATPGVCQPGIYRLTVAWQGMHPTKAPSLSCGSGAFGRDDSYRRAIAVQVAVGLPHCS
ncbi:type IV pilus modification protein PilV [Massilia terrae]|uniref:Type IV pilus modification protein PilV n=1 Tax=Massilia terrae TaxID=1811224 RepID=A0ABT2CTE0_9BURK|nr:type IV pilus modification protein PilV [Massilia terrae]MCS0657040.1 type IV pilus modification protein PilV [Massilia terrae]